MAAEAGEAHRKTISANLSAAVEENASLRNDMGLMRQNLNQLQEAAKAAEDKINILEAKLISLPPGGARESLVFPAPRCLLTSS